MHACGRGDVMWCGGDLTSTCPCCFVFPCHQPPRVRVQIQSVNGKAFPGVSIRSHQMDDQQMAAAASGKLDVLTGFQLLDAKWRLLVVEGLSQGAMAELHRRVPRSFANNATTTYLANPKVRFEHRAYTEFHLAPKDVRLRDPLVHLVETPQIYDRAQVTSLTFDALYKLFELRNSTRLASAKSQRLFPTAEMLLEIENKCVCGRTTVVWGLRLLHFATSHAHPGIHRSLVVVVVVVVVVVLDCLCPFLLCCCAVLCCDVLWCAG